MGYCNNLKMGWGLGNYVVSDADVKAWTGVTPTIIAWRQDNSSVSQLGFTAQNAPGIFSYIAIGY